MLPAAIAGKKKILTTNINQGLKDYLINSSGCTDPKAINYDKNAKIKDGSCYYSALYGTYQTATGNCPFNFASKYQLINPITKGYSCPSGTLAKQVGIYSVNGCDLKQYFCIRENLDFNQYDIEQVLLVCQARYMSSVFYENSQQYLCNSEEKENVF